MICLGCERGAATVFATSRSVWTFSSEKSLDAFAARYRLAEMAEHTWMFSITSGRTICRVGYCFPPVSRSKAWRSRTFVAGRQQYAGLDDILRLLDSHPRIEVRLLILSRFVCYVRLVISPTFPVQSPYAQ